MAKGYRMQVCGTEQLPALSESDWCLRHRFKAVWLQQFSERINSTWLDWGNSSETCSGMFADSVSSLDRTKDNLSWGKNKGKISMEVIHSSYEKWAWKCKGKSKNLRVPGFILPGEDSSLLKCKEYQFCETFAKTHTQKGLSEYVCEMLLCRVGHPKPSTILGKPGKVEMLLYVRYLPRMSTAHLWFLRLEKPGWMGSGAFWV